jgi:hypothetical protein
MHGSSSVPQELLAEIREFGGDMKETYGVPVEEIVKGIKHGVRKVNIDTDIRLAMTGAIRRYLAENPDKFDPRDYLKPAREAAKKICLARFEAFGTAGNASKIKADRLDKMAERYAKGELNQIVAKYGHINYLAMWQGLRGEDLDVNFETEPELTCTNTGVSVVYTSIYAKYSGTDATESEPGEAEEDFL